MASAGDDGVIVVAFGSMLSSLPTSRLIILAKVLGEMKQKVLWKIKGVLHFSLKLSFFWYLLLFSALVNYRALWPDW